MAGVAPLKSILKPSTTVTQSRTKEERDREIALYHANLIQNRKDVELQVLYSMEEMIELPLTGGHDAIDPSPSDVALFKEALRLFTPSDYDALVVERNINDHCGYTLCPRARTREAGVKNGTYRLVGTSGKAADFRVVEKEELEKWCSEDCARRALYVRVQLSERPPWERDTSSVNVQLMDEDKSVEEIKQDQLAEDIRRLQIVDQSGKADLARERGDQGSRTHNGMVEVSIQERSMSGEVTAPSLGDGLEERLQTMHLEMDGYTPKFGQQKNSGIP